MGAIIGKDGNTIRNITQMTKARYVNCWTQKGVKNRCFGVAFVWICKEFGIFLEIFVKFR